MYSNDVNMCIFNKLPLSHKTVITLMGHDIWTFFPKIWITSVKYETYKSYIFKLIFMWIHNLLRYHEIALIWNMPSLFDGPPVSPNVLVSIYSQSINYWKQRVILRYLYYSFIILYWF